MTRRVVLGQRGNGDEGCFISPVGVDAYTASDDALVLSINHKVSQLILLGQVSSSQTVALSLTRNPFVFITAQNSITYGSVFNDSGPVRPSPTMNVIGDGHGGYSLTRGPLSSATINSSGASLSISTTVKLIYAVYNKAF